MTSKNNENEELKSTLVSWIRKRMPDAENLTISKFERPGMGLSSITYLLDLEWREDGKQQTKAMVFRSAPTDYKVFPDYEVSHQFHIMKALKQTDVPVADMCWLEEDPDITGAQFFLMERLPGVVPQDFPPYHGSGIFFESSPEMRARMWWGSLEAMVKVHKTDVNKLGFSFLRQPENGKNAVDVQLAYWDMFFNWSKKTPDESHPTIEASMKWLKENRYEPERIGLCWGDSRMGNTLYAKDNFDVLAVMDWEMAYIGDPISDLAWFILLDRQQSTASGLARCEGTPSYEETVARYEKLTGWKVKNLFYNEILAAVRYGIILISVYRKFENQGIPIDKNEILNNVCTQRLSELLDLPSPGPKRQETSDISDLKVSVQFHFTGDNGYDWYLISDRGKGKRYKGVTDDPDCTVTTTVNYWKAIQSGELDKLEAWSSGKLNVEGDLNIMTQLEDMISDFTKNDTNFSMS